MFYCSESSLYCRIVCARLRRLGTSTVFVRCLGLGFRLGCPCGWLHKRTSCHSEARLTDVQKEPTSLPGGAGLLEISEGGEAVS